MARLSKYSPEFREEAVLLVVESGRAVAEVARELEMHPETLRSWVRRYEREHGVSREDVPVDDRARLRELERRNRDLEMENSFLKKAAAYFAKEHR